MSFLSSFCIFDSTATQIWPYSILPDVNSSGFYVEKTI